MDAQTFSWIVVFVLGGLLGARIGYVLKKLPPPPEFVACQNCAEPVRFWAKVCHHCHHSTGNHWESSTKPEQAKGAGAS
jgi:hypothetical protein